jgi:HlyD family secretion protein
MKLLADLWAIMTPHQRVRLLGAQLVSLLMATSTIIGIAAIGPFFAVLGDSSIIERNGLLHWAYEHGHFSGYRRFEIALGLAFIGMVSLSSIISVAGSVSVNRLALSIGDDLQTRLFGEYLRRPYLFHTRVNSTTLFNNIIYETARVSNGILRNLFALASGCITAVFIVLSILLVDPLLAGGVMALLAGGYLVIYLSVRHRLLRWGEVQTHHSIEQAKIVAESFGSVREIILQRAQGPFQRRFSGASQAVSNVAARIHLVGQVPKHIMECVAVATLVGVALIRESGGEGIAPSLGELTFLGFAAYRLLPMLQQMFAALVRVRADAAGFEVIAQDLRLARAAPFPIGLPSAHWLSAPREEIRVEGVSFRYAEDREPAVQRLSLRIPARGSVGLVGANGAGKTTLMDLLSGLLEPTEGRILVDGEILGPLTRSAWSSRVAHVPQRVFLLDDSIAANIAFGVHDSQIDWRRLEEAARLALLHDFVRTLPGQYGFRIGEHGMELSGGQRQRVALARALYRDAAMLLLDEATNELDGLTEEELLGTLALLRGHVTLVLIAHRLSTVRTCDVIYELEQGQIVAQGSFEDLAQRSTQFRRLAGIR